MDGGWIVTTSTESRLEKKLLPESNSNANTLLHCRKNRYSKLCEPVLWSLTNSLTVLLS